MSRFIKTDIYADKYELVGKKKFKGFYILTFRDHDLTGWIRNFYLGHEDYGNLRFMYGVPDDCISYVFPDDSYIEQYIDIYREEEFDETDKK